MSKDPKGFRFWEATLLNSSGLALADKFWVNILDCHS